MDDQTQAQTTEETAVTETTETKTETDGKTANYDGIKKFEDLPAREFFAVDTEGEKLAAYVARVIALKPEALPVIQYDKEIPAGWTVGVGKMQETVTVGDKKERKTLAIIVWPVPGIEALATDRQGLEFLADTVNRAAMDQILRPFRNRKPEEFGTAATECPTTIAEFASTRTREGIYKAFTELAPGILSNLRQKFPGVEAFKKMTPAFLRSCLENKAFALDFSEELENKGFWKRIIDLMQASADKAGLSTQVFTLWKETRDAQTVKSVEDVDFDSFFASGDEDTPA